MSMYRQQAQLDAPIEQVWRLVGDVREHTKWWPRVVNVQCDGLEQGCDYRQVTKTPTGRIETTMCVEELDDGRQILVRCLDTGTYARWLLAEAQGGTFVDVEFGMDPLNLKDRMIDRVAGKLYFRRWLEQSLDALARASQQQPDEQRADQQPHHNPKSHA